MSSVFKAQLGADAAGLYQSDRQTLAEEVQVLVSFNYRLRVLSFFGVLETESRGSFSDLGLQEHLAALRWDAN